METGSVVGVHYDAMLAKVIAHADTRELASARLAAALAAAQLHGVITNRDLLVAVLRSPAWLAGEVDTSFLQHHDPAELSRSPVDDAGLRVHAAAAALAGAAARRADAHVQAELPTGWRNLRSALQTTSYAVDGRQVQVGYGDDLVEVDGVVLQGVRVWSASRDLVDVEVGGLRRRYDVHLDGATAYVDSALGASVLVEAERFPLPGSGLAAGALAAPLPGTVVRLDVAVGDGVEQGQVLVVLEAMKMEHAVRAGAAGTVTHVHVGKGDQVADGALLITLADQRVVTSSSASA